MWKSRWKVLKTVKFKNLHKKTIYISKSNFTFSKLNNTSIIALHNKKRLFKSEQSFKFQINHFLKNETMSLNESSSFEVKLAGAEGISVGGATGFEAVVDLIGAPGPSSPKRVAIL